jgi:pyridinium-3,5-biscarboxylic acid mononucleotide sulfurtransferase
VQLAEDELDRALAPAGRAEVIAAVRGAGYRRVEINEQPFRSGSLNDGVIAGVKPLPLISG